jgi:putative flippase GtrA
VVKRIVADERFRFLLIGAINTGIGFGLFTLLELAFGRHTSYLVSLYASYAIAVVIAFVLHRRFTFRAHHSGGAPLSFLRFSLVYLVALAVNTVALPLLVEGARWHPIAAQAVVVAVSTAISYLGHKFFSFRHAKPVPPGSVEAD